MASSSNTRIDQHGGSGPSNHARAKDPSANETPLLRFGLRQLFWFFAVMSTLLAGIVSSQGVTSLVLLLAAIVVMVHVFATALGSRLRERADGSQTWEDSLKLPDESGAFSPQRSASLAAVKTAPRSPWHARGSTVLPWLPRAIAAAAFIGGTFGMLVLAATIGHRTSAAGIVVSSISLAVLGGWFAFICGSFYGVFRDGFREAIAEQQKDETGRSKRPK